jgi:cellulose 1,4-beta-cellobiosidase
VAIPQGGIYDVGASEYGDPITPTVPAAPSSLRVSGATSTSLSLTWSDNAANETGYQLERSADGADFLPLATLPANTVSWLDGGLASGTTFHYRVRAYNGAGYSAYAGPVSGTTLAVTLPPAPTGLTAVASAQKGRILLSWQPSTGATSYKVKRSLTSGGPYSTVATGVTSTSYTDGGLRTKTTYYYVVSAVNQSGESPNSNQASAKTR